MGIVLSTVASQQEIARTNDLDMKISEIHQAKIDLQKTAAELTDAGSDLDPKSPAAKQLQARREALQNLEKKLDMQLDLYQKEKEQVKESLGAIAKL